MTWTNVTRRLFLGAISLLALGSALAQSSDEILIWTDATRLPGFELYQTTHPDVKLRIVTVDLTDLPTKIQLFNRTKSGWPDVAFGPDTGVLGYLLDPRSNYLADLNPLVDESILDDFAPGSLDICRVEGKLYCLHNDLAQHVLWYNAKLMKDFEYEVPTTWEEYQALGLRVAKEHPGYVIGAAGGGIDQISYFWPSRCPVSQTPSPDTVRINLNDDKCTRVANMLDSLVSAKVVSTLSPFDPDFIELAGDNKLLMLPQASWFGEYIFKASYKTPAGQLSASAPLRWADENRPYAGAQGGMYFVSKYAKNLEGAVDVAVWMSTSPEYQADAPTFPAYLPAAALWGEKVSADEYYASDILPVLQQAAGLIDTSWGFPRFTAPAAFTSITDAGLKAGRTYAQMLPEIQTQLGQLAKVSGYRVVE